MRQGVSLLVLCSCACSPAETPLPAIASVEPSSMPADSRFLLTVELDGLPVKVDYGADSAQMVSGERVRIAEKDFDVLDSQESGRRLTVDIIPWLAVGQQDVQVQLQDGRQVVLAQGYDVKPPLKLTGFEIEAIGPQVRHRPFTARIRAVGPDAALFQGRVIVRSTQADVDPKVSDAFAEGELVQTFRASDSIESSLSIIVEDYAGHTGISNEFVLRAP
jgi:hypothetical protein